MREAHDPPGDEACDLHHAEPPGRRVDDDAVALVVLARLVEIGAEEEPRVIDDLGDAALDRRAIHVAIEDRHEDRHPLHRRHAKAEFGRGRGEPGEADHAVGGRDDQVAPNRGDARGIAKEIGAPERGDEASQPSGAHIHHRMSVATAKPKHELVAFGVDRRELAAQRFDDAH